MPDTTYAPIPQVIAHTEDGKPVYISQEFLVQLHDILNGGGTVSLGTLLSTGNAAQTAADDAQAAADAAQGSATTNAGAIAAIDAAYQAADAAQDITIQAAQDAADAAQAAADAVPDVTSGTSFPGSPKTGDFHIDRSDDNKVFTWNGSSWAEVSDARIATLVTDLDTAEASITSLSATQASDNTARADEITALEAVNTANGLSGSTNITARMTAVDGGSAASSTIDQLEAIFTANQLTSGTDITSTASALDVRLTAVDGGSASSESISQLSARITTEENNVDALQDNFDLSGNILLNGRLRQTDSSGKPAYILPTRNATALTALSAISGGGMRIDGSSDADAKFGWPAFRVDADMRYRIIVRHTAASAVSAFELHVNELDSDIGGDTHVGGSSTASVVDGVVAETRQVEIVANGTTPTSLTVAEYTYDPTATAKWASIEIGSDSDLTGNHDIDYVVLIPETAVIVGRISTAEADIVTNAATQVSDNSARASEITALDSRVTTEETNVDTLQGDVTTLQGNVTTLDATATALDSRLTAVDGGTAVAQSFDQLVAQVNSVTRNFTIELIDIDGTTITIDGVDVEIDQAPDGYNVGDQRIDETDGNKLYRWDGVTWADATDTRVVNNTASVTNFAEAYATDNGATARLLWEVNTGSNVASLVASSATGYSDGTWNGSAISLTANEIILDGDAINLGSNTEFETTDNTFITENNSYRYRYGGPFGSSSDLLQWYGPTSVAQGSETGANAAFAVDNNGAIYQNFISVFSDDATQVSMPNDDTFYTLATFTATNISSNGVILQASALFYHQWIAGTGDGNVIVTAQLRRGSTTIAEKVVNLAPFYDGVFGGMTTTSTAEYDIAFTKVDNPSAGDHTYTFRAKMVGGDGTPVDVRRADYPGMSATRIR